MSKKVIDLDTEVIVQNNIHSTFVYKTRDGVIELEDFGDEEYVSLRVLKSMATGKGKKMLRNMYIIIVGTNSDEYTVDDILNTLKLTKVYDEAKEVLDSDVVETDAFVDFLENTSSKELARVLNNHENLIVALTDQAIDMYKNGEIESAIIETVLKEQGIEDIYSYLEDVRNSRGN